MSSDEAFATIQVMTRNRITQTEAGSRATPGDRVVVHGHAVGERERTGLVVLAGLCGVVEYRARSRAPGPDTRRTVRDGHPLAS